MDAVRDAGMDGSEARVTVAEAAERLQITKEAVRKRIHRGTLRSDRAQDGTVMVYVPASPTSDTTPSSAGEATDLLYEEMRERIADLRVQLEAERTASAELRRIVAALTQRIPELDAPQGPSGGPPSAGVGSNREEAPPAGDGAMAEDAERPRRSWWREFFGIGV